MAVLVLANTLPIKQQLPLIQRYIQAQTACMKKISGCFGRFVINYIRSSNEGTIFWGELELPCGCSIRNR